jgi:hypothetical protein
MICAVLLDYCPLNLLIAHLPRRQNRLQSSVCHQVSFDLGAGRIISGFHVGVQFCQLCTSLLTLALYTPKLLVTNHSGRGFPMTLDYNLSFASGDFIQHVV